MSELALESFVTYKSKPEANSYDFYPLPRSVKNDESGTTITLGDIPFPAGIPLPEDCFSLLYGFRDPLEELKRQYAIARKNDMSLVKISFGLDVDEIILGTTTEADLPRTKFLNIRRISSDLQALIIDGMNELSAKESKFPIFFDKIADIGTRPDLICEAIKKESIFKNVNSVVYSLPDHTPRGRQVISIFSTQTKNIVFRGEKPFNIILPNLRNPSLKIISKENTIY
jgi:hypothetical protein